MSVDLYDGTEADPRCTCRQVQGNDPDDGICGSCRKRGIGLCDRCEATAKLNEDNECPTCADREPGDSHYEDHGTVRHELQDADGVWRR